MTQPTYTCQQCGHTWTPRPKTFEQQDRTKPVACPQCQSRKWSEPNERAAG